MSTEAAAAAEAAAVAAAAAAAAAEATNDAITTPQFSLTPKNVSQELMGIDPDQIFAQEDQESVYSRILTLQAELQDLLVQIHKPAPRISTVFADQHLLETLRNFSGTTPGIVASTLGSVMRHSHYSGPCDGNSKVFAIHMPNISMEFLLGSKQSSLPNAGKVWMTLGNYHFAHAFSKSNRKLSFLRSPTSNFPGELDLFPVDTFEGLSDRQQQHLARLQQALHFHIDHRQDTQPFLHPHVSNSNRGWYFTEFCNGTNKFPLYIHGDNPAYRFRRSGDIVDYLTKAQLWTKSINIDDSYGTRLAPAIRFRRDKTYISGFHALDSRSDTLYDIFKEVAAIIKKASAPAQHYRNCLRNVEDIDTLLELHNICHKYPLPINRKPSLGITDDAPLSFHHFHELVFPLRRTDDLPTLSNALGWGQDEPGYRLVTDLLADDYTAEIDRILQRINTAFDQTLTKVEALAGANPGTDDSWVADVAEQVSEREASSGTKQIFDELVILATIRQAFSLYTRMLQELKDIHDNCTEMNQAPPLDGIPWTMPVSVFIGVLNTTKHIIGAYHALASQFALSHFYFEGHYFRTAVEYDLISALHLCHYRNHATLSWIKGINDWDEYFGVFDCITHTNCTRVTPSRAGNASRQKAEEIRDILHK